MRLIERAWYQNHPIKWLLLPLNVLFWLLSATRRLLYRIKVLATPKLDVPVVIVGNIGVGGNGKTPVVVYLVEQLQHKGYKVGVISRGYGGEKREQPLLLTADTTPTEAGDEPVLIYQRCNVPVVVSPDRVAGVERLMAEGCTIIISDDGLQHYRLKRDVELVIVDGKRRFGNGWLMPAGPLREGLWRLKTVDSVIVNGGLADVGETVMLLRGQELINLKTDQRLSVEQFLQQQCSAGKINAMAGIGNPDRFYNTLSELGFSLAQKRSFVDHHHFSEQDFSSFSEEIPLLMTEKDAVKCKEYCHQNSWYLPVDAQFNDAQGEQLIELILTRCNNYGL